MLSPELIVSSGLLTGDQGAPIVETRLLRDLFSFYGDPAFSTMALVAPRRSGKSTGLAALALHQLLTRPNAFVLWTAGSKDSANDILTQKLSGPIKSCPALKELGLAVVDGEIRNPSIGSTVKILASSEVSAPGRTVSLLIIDEARDLPDEVFERLRPSAAGGKTICAGNPGDPSGFFYELATRPQPGVFSRSYSACENPAIPKEFIEREKARLFARGEWGRQIYLREWEAAWVRVEESPLMLPEHVEACEREPGHADLARSPGEELFFLAADLSLVTDLTSIIALAVNSSRSDLPYRVCETIVLDPKSFPSRTIPLEHVQKLISDMANKYAPVRISIDRYQGEQLCQALQREGLPIVSIQPTAELNFRAFSRLRDAIHQRRIVWPRDERLRNELLNLALTETPSGFKVIDSRKRFHRDVSFSLALALDSAMTLLEEHCPIELLS